MMYNCFTHTIFWLLRFFQWVKMLALSLLHNWIAYFLSCRRVLEPYSRSVFCICPWNGLASHSEKIVVLLDSSCSQDSLFPPFHPLSTSLSLGLKEEQDKSLSRNVCSCEWFAWQCKLTKMASRLLENEKNKTVLENCYKICKQLLLYRYWWNTRIFPFTKKSYLHHAQWRYHFYCFFRGHSNKSCNLIGSLPGQYFPISAHGPRYRFHESPSTSQLSLSFFHKYTSFCWLGSIFKQTSRSLPQANK